MNKYIITNKGKELDRVYNELIKNIEIENRVDKKIIKNEERITEVMVGETLITLEKFYDEVTERTEVVIYIDNMLGGFVDYYNKIIVEGIKKVKEDCTIYYECHTKGKYGYEFNGLYETKTKELTQFKSA